MFSFLRKNKSSVSPEFTEIPIIIAGQIRAGKSPAETSLHLQNMALDQERADFFVQEHYPKILYRFYHERCSWKDCAVAFVFGLAVSVSVSFIWGKLAAWTGDRLGVWAVLIGILCGFSVSWGTDGKKGVALQLIAAFCACLGFFIGKYYIFYHYWGVILAQHYGEVAKIKMAVPLSAPALRQFVDFFYDDMSRNIFTVFFDTFWFMLGAIWAWKVPEGSGVSEDTFAYLKNFPQDHSFRRPIMAVKAPILLAVGFFILLVFFWLLFSAHIRPVKKFLNEYGRADIEFVINATMRDNPEFQEHFVVLKKDDIIAVIDDLEKFLKTHTYASELEEALLSKRNDFNKHIFLMANLAYPEEFFVDPGQFPKIVANFYRFYAMHFQVMLYQHFLKVNFGTAPDIEPTEEVTRHLNRLKVLMNKSQQKPQVQDTGIEQEP